MTDPGGASVREPRSFGAMPPAGAEWQIGLTAEKILEVKAAIAAALEAARPVPAATPPQFGTWPEGDIRRVFVEGVAWWEYESRGATIWASDRRKAEAEAERRYGAAPPEPASQPTYDGPVSGSLDTICRRCHQRFGAHIVKDTPEYPHGVACCPEPASPEVGRTVDEWADIICDVDPHFWHRYPDLNREVARVVHHALQPGPRGRR